MGKIVLLDFVDSDFDNGFTVKLRIETEGDRIWIGDAKGRLPGCRNILVNYSDWQSRYLARVAPMRSGVRIAGSVVPDASPQAIQAASQKLKRSLNDWLSSPSMFSIEREILHKLTDKSEEIRFIFQTEAPQLQQLPWHSWDIFRQPNYIKSEAGLYLPVGNQRTNVKREKVKVLAVFGKQEGIGNATKIKTEKDWELLQKYLSAKSNAELIRLDEPTLEELCEQIEAHCPQIFFFAGHSRSEEDGTVGLIELNHQESITIDNLETDLIEAVEQGLQLAIFNSCEGLAIARQLANIHVPNIIVMREPVPDEVAQKFLQRFLEAFAQGQPLHLAVRKAREKLNRLENKYPGATWLPMVFQNPAEPPLTWGGLGGVEISEETVGNQGSVMWLPTSIPNNQSSRVNNNNSSSTTIQPTLKNSSSTRTPPTLANSSSTIQPIPSKSSSIAIQPPLKNSSLITIQPTLQNSSSSQLSSSQLIKQVPINSLGTINQSISQLVISFFYKKANSDTFWRIDLMMIGVLTAILIIMFIPKDTKPEYSSPIQPQQTRDIPNNP
jgi:CHAT domain